MIKYISTRNPDHKVSSSKAILSGQAPDGGLYIPEHLEDIKCDYHDILSGDFRSMAKAVWNLFFPDYGQDKINSLVEKSYEGNLKKLGVVDKESPNSIAIYADSFEDKENLIKCIDKYNEQAEEEDKIIYTDYVGMIMSSVSSIIKAVSYVLMGFVGVSLIVSSIMIGIITYISVLERRKEIGILRAIGASKHDISSVFNAETFIVGLVAGLFGVGITGALLIPINAILHYKLSSVIVSAAFPTKGAIILVILSVCLTLIAGLIPAKIASRKDPVEALRSE